MFGAVRACRHFGVAGADEMAGLFINTLPMRAQIAPGLPVSELLKGLRAQQLALRRHEHTPLFEIQRWSGVAPLFQSVVIFENATLDAATGARPGPQSFELRGAHRLHPLALYCVGWAAAVAEDHRGREPGACCGLKRMCGHLATLLEAMSRKTRHSAVGALPMLTPPESAMSSRALE